jgi:hypothetical protein
MNYESEILDLSELQSNYNKTSEMLQQKLMALSCEFIDQKDSLPKYQIFKLLTSPYWEN